MTDYNITATYGPGGARIYPELLGESAFDIRVAIPDVFFEGMQPADGNNARLQLPPLDALSWRDAPMFAELFLGWIAPLSSGAFNVHEFTWGARLMGLGVDRAA